MNIAVPLAILLGAIAVSGSKRRPRPQPQPELEPEAGQAQVQPTPAEPALGEDDPADDPADEPRQAEYYDGPPPCGIGQQGRFACANPATVAPEGTSVAMAAGAPAPLWPISTTQAAKVVVPYRDVQKKWHGKWGRHFGSKRVSKDVGERHHAGLDLTADEGDVVRAMEPGFLLGIYPFHHGTWSLYVLQDSGIWVNYGEVGFKSWQEFGFPRQLAPGQMIRVDRGQPLGRIGRQSGGSTMLHLETYTPKASIPDIRAGRLRWLFDQPAPDALRDPTRMLIKAQRVWYGEEAPTS